MAFLILASKMGTQPALEWVLIVMAIGAIALAGGIVGHSIGAARAIRAFLEFM